VERWLGHAPEGELGVVVHGASLLAGSAEGGVAAGLRCVFAHAGGLHLPILVVASGIYAEAAGRRQFPGGAGAAGRRADEGRPGAAASDPVRDLTVVVRINGREGRAEAFRSEASGGTDHFRRQSDYWIPCVPGDGRLTITTSWPEIGLAAATVDLSCDAVDDLPQRVVALRTPGAA
jgi:hypothetical protein